MSRYCFLSKKNLTSLINRYAELQIQRQVIIMPSFAPRNLPVRKSEILDYKIFEFLQCLEKESSNEKLLIKAENVKIAKLNFLKAKLASNKSFSSEDVTKGQKEMNKNIQNQIFEWESISFSEIEKFCKKSSTGSD